MTHRYRRYARRVGIASSLKELRHYSATELLHAGDDLNTVAGRLGHAEGSTTLKFYAQFTATVDQPPGFQPQADLLAVLHSSGPGVQVGQNRESRGAPMNCWLLPPWHDQSWTLVPL